MSFFCEIKESYKLKTSRLWMFECSQCGVKKREHKKKCFRLPVYKRKLYGKYFACELLFIEREKKSVYGCIERNCNE